MTRLYLILCCAFFVSYAEEVNDIRQKLETKKLGQIEGEFRKFSKENKEDAKDILIENYMKGDKVNSIAMMFSTQSLDENCLLDAMNSNDKTLKGLGVMGLTHIKPETYLNDLMEYSKLIEDDETVLKEFYAESLRLMKKRNILYFPDGYIKHGKVTEEGYEKIREWFFSNSYNQRPVKEIEKPKLSQLTEERKKQIEENLEAVNSAIEKLLSQGADETDKTLIGLRESKMKLERESKR